MKKFIALLLAVVMVLGLCACSVSGGKKTEITLWTYPVGQWGDQATVEALVASFNEKYPDIGVTVEYLTYADGDDKVNTAIEGKATPDIIVEGPERLVTNWGAKGVMVDLSDLWTDEVKADTYESVVAACQLDGKFYEYPFTMTAHCMAINKTVFEAAGAMQYIDEETHTWTTENFIKAVDAVYAHTGKTVGAVYCAGQGGDQGTRALVNNLYGGTYTNADYTAYTWTSEENLKALNLLNDLEGIKFDASLAGGDEANEFAKGNLAMAFCWNGATHVNNLETIGDSFEVLPMAFPSQNGTDVQLCGGIWGFGIFDNGDAARIDAAKTFIKYFCDSEATVDAVKAANYFAVRETAEGADLSTIWADNAIMAEYNVLMPLLGDYYQVTTGWAEARTAWWNMLQQVGASDGTVEAITAAVEQYVNQANGK